MIGALDPSRKEVTVVGAGFAGLLAAYRLDNAGWQVTLLEASSRAGGLVRTTATPYGITESGPHSFLATPAVQALCAELGVELLPVCKESTARYIWRAGALHRFPLKPIELAQALARAQFVPAALAAGDPETESVETWALRHLGQAALDYAINPFLRGIYAARPSEIAMGAAFPKLMVPEGRSLLTALVARRLTGGAKRERKARPPMMAPRLGMGAVTSALEEKLRARLGERFRLGTPVTRLPDDRNVVLAVPAEAAASLLEPVDTGLAHALRAVPYAPLASVTVFSPLSSFARPPVGVGVLVPEIEKRECLGILFNSSAFAGRVTDEATASFTIMFAQADASDEELAAIARRELSALLGHVGPAGPFVIHRWPRAIPRYGAELVAAWRVARAGWCARPGHVLFGNHAGEVSLRGMIERAEAFR